MALRQVLFIRGISNYGLFSKHNVDVRFARNLRSNRKPTTVRSFNSAESFKAPTNIQSDAILKALAFTGAFTVGSFIGVTIWEYEKIRSRAVNALKNAMNFGWVKRNKQINGNANGNSKINELQAEYNRVTKDITAWWYQLTPAERIFAPILGLNVLVFGLWRVPRMRPFMLKYFCSNPAGTAICWPMFLSTFSHFSFFHLCANMYVLHSFSHGAVNFLGPEQFVGLYLSAGVISSFASYVYKVLTLQPGLSLGASGAIMAILAFVCTQYPDTKMSILFLPQLQFSAENAIQGIIALDLAGVIFKWKFFDHAAHLGGAAVGLFWCHFGPSYLWPLREHFVGYWHQLRGKTKK
ncbi:unnamed protein product [Diamesa serratosioi]